ncbi:MAG: PilZ domain-containing protein [Deltaproteobacteria bacterium]|nr:PilZ domain-containing protein [Deltaproteobacteria bacterium]
MMSILDQRSAPRVRVQGLRLALPDGDRFVRGNVSVGGVGFETDECLPLAVGDTIRVTLAATEDDEALDFVASVRHIKVPQQGQPFYVGAAFHEPDELVINPLFRFVEESLLAAFSKPGRLNASARAGTLLADMAYSS